MQGICQFRTFVGRDVATIFRQQGRVDLPEGFENLAGGEFF